MAEIVERKKNLRAEDKSNLKPSSSNSPMITYGRYIYVFSKWYDYSDIIIENGKNNYDDEGKPSNRNEAYNLYGVDIHDSLSNMCHVKLVQFKTKKEKLDYLMKKYLRIY
jgi:hypothetical protein